MSKICKKCGWEHPDSMSITKCVICREPFDEITCRICGATVKKEDFVKRAGTVYTLCRKCHNERERIWTRDYKARERQKLEDTKNEWMAKVEQVPKDYPTLTEEQWLKACQHFKGCAICGNKDIEARGFFIPFKYGGRYCDWNVLPMCLKCAGSDQDTANPFKSLVGRDHRDRTDIRRKQIVKITEYLGGILDGALKDL